MELLSTSAQNNQGSKIKDQRSRNAGFTLVEILITIGLIGLIAALGLFISFDFYRDYSFRSERSVVVSVLQKARSQSMDNVDEKKHGVHFFLDPANSNKLTYLIFECPNPCSAYPTPSSSDVPVTASYGSTITNPVMPFDVLFDQLSGNCLVTTGSNPFNCDPTTQAITVSDSTKSYQITVNSEGRIDWE